MKLWVFNQDFTLLGSLSTYIYLSWTEEYRGRGVFTLIARDTAANVAMLQEEYFIYMSGKQTAMVIKSRKYESSNSAITVDGYTTLELMDQRHLLGTYIFSNAETGMKQILSNNLRGLPDVDIKANQGYTETVDTQYTNKAMLDIFPEVCAATDLGIRMLFDYENKQHVFDVYKGADRTFGQSANVPVQFSDEWGSLADVAITVDKSVFKNVAYVYGEGEGSARLYEIVGTAMGRDRYELPVDARDLQWDDDPESDDYQTETQYRTTLQARGITKLNDHIKTTNFQAEVSSTDFGVKYNLGDKVTCRSQRYGMQMDARITMYKQEIENNVSTISLTLGDPTITAIGELKLWLS